MVISGGVADVESLAVSAVEVRPFDRIQLVVDPEELSAVVVDGYPQRSPEPPGDDHPPVATLQVRPLDLRHGAPVGPE